MTIERTPTAGAAWVLLWSHSQCALHIEPLADMLSKNRLAYTEDHPMDYVPLVMGTREVCDAVAAGVCNNMHRRRYLKAKPIDQGAR